MKKLLYMAVAAIAALSSCQSDDVASGEDGNGVSNANAPVFTATIEGEGETRTQLVEGSTAGKLTKVEWLNTDEVMVFCMDNNEFFALLGKYSVSPGTPASTATLTPPQKFICKDPQTPQICYAVYPASFSHASIDDLDTYTMPGDNGSNFVEWCLCNLALPATQTYKGADISQIAPMVAYYAGKNMDNANLEFKNMTALLAITVESADFSQVSSIKVTADKKLNGDFQMLRAEDGTWSVEETSSDVTDAQKVLTLNCQNEGANTTISAGESKTFYVSIPPQTYDYLQIQVTDGTTSKYMRTKASSISVERNTIYPIAFAKNYDPNLLAGEFSVSATKKVKFTKANLYWDGSAYQFEADQTNYPEAWNTSHIGHFYWSQTATVAYEQAYSDSNRGTTDKLFCGEDNKLTVSGTSDLYVLSAEEWHYLTGLYNEFYYSGNRSDTYRFANARVNGVAGLLIFPDGYNGTVSGDGIAEVNDDEVSNENYPSASIPDATWSEMEAAGVVFLPAAGCRSAKIVNNCGNNGYYWSSTLVDEDNAYMLYDYYGIVDCPKNQDRPRGCSIRLVQTVE